MSYGEIDEIQELRARVRELEAQLTFIVVARGGLATETAEALADRVRELEEEHRADLQGILDASHRIATLEATLREVEEHPCAYAQAIARRVLNEETT